jgi:4'-phosphopantetheinyl transferase
MKYKSNSEKLTHSASSNLENCDLHAFQSGATISCFFDTGEVSAATAQQFLSQDEINISNQIADLIEKRHFVLRRAVQRQYVKRITGDTGPASQVELRHQLDAAPLYLPDPRLSLSFSSSGKLYVSASSKTARVGVDCEKRRAIPDSLSIAKRFFHAEETEFLHKLDSQCQDVEFLKLWTIKEACLKAIGKGVVYGLDAFIIRARNGKYTVDPPTEFGASADWQIQTELIQGNYWVTVVIYD